MPLAGPSLVRPNFCYQISREEQKHILRIFIVQLTALLVIRRFSITTAATPSQLVARVSVVYTLIRDCSTQNLHLRMSYQCFILRTKQIIMGKCSRSVF